jgi:hypothetical protein
MLESRLEVLLERRNLHNTSSNLVKMFTKFLILVGSIG